MITIALAVLLKGFIVFKNKVAAKGEIEREICTELT